MKFHHALTPLAIAAVMALSACAVPAPPTDADATPATATPAATASPAATAAVPSVVATPLDKVKSFRSKGTYDLRIDRAEGQPIDQQLSFDGAWQRMDHPLSFDMEILMTGLEMTGEVPGAPNAMAVLLIGDKVYANFGDKQWLSSTRDQAPLEQLPYFFATPEDLVPPLGDLKRLGEETVNGVSTVRFAVDGAEVLDRFFVDDKLDARGKVKDSSGDVWIAADGGYLVKMAFQADVTGKPVQDATGASVDSDQTLSWSYERYDFNSDFAINPPSGAGQPAVIVSLPGVEGATLRLPPTSELKSATGPSIMAVTQLPPADVRTLLEAELTGMGWQPTGGAPPVWTKDNHRLTLVVGGPAKGPARISILLETGASN